MEIKIQNKIETFYQTRRELINYFHVFIIYFINNRLFA